MASIKFKYIILHHFMSYDHSEFDLDRNGYIFISGINNNEIDNAKSNGSGKSSLFSALCWCLTGETPNGNKKVENIYLSGETYVEVIFTLNNNEYILKRTKNPSNLIIIINGGNKSGKGIRDSEKLLSEYLPDITSSLINSVIILGQGLPKRFTNNTPAGRKEILEKLSNSDFMISDIKERIKNRSDELEENKLQINNRIIENSTKINLLGKLISEYTSNLDNINLSKLEIELDKLKSDKIKLQQDIDSFSSAKEEVDIQLKLQQTKLENISSEYNNELNSLDLIDEEKIVSLVSEIASLKAALKIKQDEINKLESITDICPTCGQKIPGVTKIDTSQLKIDRDNIEDNISILSLTLEENKNYNSTVLNSFNSKYEEKKKELNNTISIFKSDIDNYTNIISNKNIEYKKISDEILKIEIDINNITKTKEELKSKIIENSFEKDILEKSVETDNLIIEDLDKRLDIIYKINTIIKRDFRGYLLSNIIEFINTRCQLYSVEVFGSNNFLFELDGNNILISYDNKEYESLSGGEKQKVDIIIQLAIRDMLCNYLNFSSNILVLDEITDSLDIIGSQNILNLISKELLDVEAIYIISHHSDFSIPWDEEITIVKDDNKISRIIS